MITKYSNVVRLLLELVQLEQVTESDQGVLVETISGNAIHKYWIGSYESLLGQTAWVCRFVGTSFRSGYQHFPATNNYLDQLTAVDPESLILLAMRHKWLLARCDP